MKTFLKCFISLIISYKVNRKIYLIRCTTNQVGTGHKLVFQPKNPVWAKWAAINNKHGCGTAEVRCGNFKRVSYYWYYHIRPGKRHLFSVVPPTKSAQAVSSNFSPNIQFGQIGSNQQQKWMWHGWGVMQTFRKCFISLIISYKFIRNTALLRCCWLMSIWP